MRKKQPRDLAHAGVEQRFCRANPRLVVRKQFGGLAGNLFRQLIRSGFDLGGRHALVRQAQPVGVLAGKWKRRITRPPRSLGADNPVDVYRGHRPGRSEEARFKSADFFSGPGLKCIKITNVGVGEFVLAEGEFLPYKFSDKYSAFKVTKGSIVLALTRTIIGAGLKVALVPEQYDQSMVNQRVAAISARTEKIGADFLFAFLRTRRVLEYVQASVNTLMQPNLSIVDLRMLLVPVPPVSVQLRLVESFGALSEQVKVLASVYQRKLAALDELKMSLLHQAFTGALS